MDIAALKPCPFCGAEPAFISNERSTLIQCPSCWAEQPEVADFQAENHREVAFAAWNRRAPTNTQADE